MGDNSDRLVLLDRDGVINEDRPESVRSESDFVFLPHVPEAIAELNHKGYRILIVHSAGSWRNSLTNAWCICGVTCA